MTMPQQQLQIQVPDDMEQGVYANLTAVWFTPFEFTLDFAVMQPPAVDGDGNPVLPARVVSRIKFPTTQVFQLIKAINEAMTGYENTFGPIEEPQPKAP